MPPVTEPSSATSAATSASFDGRGAVWRALYPFASHELSAGGARMHYLDEGPELDVARGPTGNGPEPLLMVHGNPTWSFYWRRLVLAFRDRYRVIVPDHVGCGLSEKPQDYPYRLAQHVQNLCELVERLDLRRVTLLAHDWGGAIGLGTALRLRERFSRIVLFNTAAFRDTRMPLRIRVCRAPLLGALGVRGLNGFARAALTMATERPGGLEPAVRAGLIGPYDSWANRVAILRFVQDIPMHPDHASYETLRQIEEGLTTLRDLPTALIWGMRDWCFTPHFLQRFRQEFFPAAEAHELHQAGHYVIEDEPERVCQIVDAFLQKHPLSSAPATQPA